MGGSVWVGLYGWVCMGGSVWVGLYGWVCMGGSVWVVPLPDFVTSHRLFGDWWTAVSVTLLVSVLLGEEVRA